MANTQEQMDSMLPAVDDDTRSTEEYLEDTKPMDISSVPVFQRPMDASKNDRLVGEDDAGNPVYRTMLGNTYTVRRNPDQRTTRTKIQEDVLPKVKDWLQNPETPSQEQVVQMGKAIAKSVYDLVSIPGDLATGKKSASDVTLGDVYDTTGMMAVGSLGFKVPKDALRTFGGKGAKNLDVGAFAQARELMKDGAQRINPNNPEQFYDLNKKVWWETGWYIDPNDNQWRFEIDDSKSEVTLGKLPLTEKELKESGGDFKLSEVFSHDELYKQYPHLKDITVRFYHPSIGKNSTEKKDSVAGYMNSQEGILAINTKNNTPRQMKKTILHEIQHSIQNYEGFTPGANSDYIDPSVLSKGENKIQGQIADLYSENINLKVNNAKLLGPDFNKSVSVDDAFPRGLARFYANEGYTVDQIQMDLLDRQRDYLDKFMNQHPNVQELQDSGAAGQVTENLKKLRENILKETGFRSGLPRLATEYYMGAGGEIESRLVELSSYMSSSDRKTGTGMYRNNPRPFEDYGEPDTPGFPLDRVTGMLASEGRDNKLMFRGEEGVDAVAQGRRAIPTENIGSSDIYLDIPRNDFRVQRDSEGVVIKPKKGKHLFPAVDKLKSLFKDEKSVLDVLNLKKDDTFTFEGEDYKFQKIGIHTVGKDELDRNQFLLSPEEGDNYARVVTVIAEDSLGRTNYIGLSKFLDDPEKYIGKNVSDQTTSIFGRIKNKLGLTPSTSESANPTLEDFGYYVDNPAKWGNTDWAKNKQASAEKYAKEGGKSAQKLLSGPQTAFLGIDNKKPLYLDTEFLSTLKGANDEVTDMSNPKYVDLKKSVEEEGFVPDQKGNKIMVGINHKGEAFIMEGNNRVAIAKEFGAPSVKAEVRYYNGAEEVDGPYSPQNILKYASQAPRQFAEGGTVAMNQQMSFAFEDGGLRDDGMRQDPVSGNEVPSGSMAKEVRDDIPAQLSEGEYVVPADVVRYYGVKFFEDIRDRAKMGLRDMEARGRIGGEPVPAGGPMNNDDLSPEEMAAISEMMGMAQGGAVDMYKQQQNMYNPPAQAVGNPMQQMNAGGTVRGYNQAGSVTSQPTEQDMLNAAAAVNQSRASGTDMSGAPLGFSIYRPQAEIDAEAQGAIDEVTPEPEKVTLYSPEGVPIELELPRDQATYDALLSQGYTTEVVAKTPQPRGSDNDDPPPTPDPTAWMKNFDYTNASKLAEQTSALFDPKSPGLLGGILTAGAFGAIGKMSNVAQANANIALLEAQGVNTDSLKAKRDKYIETSGLSGIQKTIPWIMDGDQLKAQVEQVMGNDLFKNTPKPSTTPTPKPKPPAESGGDDETPTPTPATAAASLRQRASNAENTTQLEAFQKAADIAQEAADKNVSIAEVSQTGSQGYGNESAASVATGGQGDQGQGSGWGGMNKGGLMATKPKRKTKRQYKKGGLAGKK